MKFCPKCGTLMSIKNIEGRRVWACPSCGYEEPIDSGGNISLRTRIEHSAKERLIVVKKDKKMEVLPKTRAICPRCGYTEAYYWLVQTRAADEPPTRFFKCVRCGHVWREYD